MFPINSLIVDHMEETSIKAPPRPPLETNIASLSHI